MISSCYSLIPFLPLSAAAKSEDSTKCSPDYCSVFLELLNSQFQFSNLIILAQVKVKVKVMLRQTVSRSVYLGIKHDQISITVR
jgi:hypothetical protein